MALTNGYVTVRELAAYISHPDQEEDDALEDAIHSASRAIDDYCGRHFYTSDTATARRYIATDYYCLKVDDIAVTTDLVVKTDDNNDGTYETTWAASDYELDPIDGVVDGIPGWPYTKVHAIGSYAFPLASTGARRFTVQVTARWGWAAVPEPVRQSCLQVASEEFNRRHAPFGVRDTMEFGPIRLSADSIRAVSAKLNVYRKMTSRAGIA